MSYIVRGWTGNPAAVSAYKATLEAAALAAGVGYWFWPRITEAPKGPAGQGGQPGFICCLPVSFVLPEAPNGVPPLPNETAALALQTALQ